MSSAVEASCSTPDRSRAQRACDLEGSATTGAADRVDDIGEGYRRYVIGSHLLFNVERKDAVEVIWLLHQRMDPTRHL